MQLIDLFVVGVVVVEVFLAIHLSDSAGWKFPVRLNTSAEAKRPLL